MLGKGWEAKGLVFEPCSSDVGREERNGRGRIDGCVVYMLDLPWALRVVLTYYLSTLYIVLVFGVGGQAWE